MLTYIKKSQILLLVICVFISMNLSGCLIDDRIEVMNNSELRYYSINSSTILESLDHGNFDLFTLQKTTPTVISSKHLSSVSWSQNDYYRVAQALLNFAWGEPLGAHNLSSAYFTMSCSDVKSGFFTVAHFDAFTIVLTNEVKTRIEYHISILPMDNMVLTSKEQFIPNLSTMEPIDIIQNKITAEGALKIAENKGGFGTRTAVDNACVINAIAPGVDGKGWDIEYQNSHNPLETIYEIVIDPQTGD